MRRSSFGSMGSMTLSIGIILIGCGDLTSGGVGELEVIVAADSVPVAASAATSQMAYASFGMQAPPDSPDIQGALTLRIQVFVLRAPAQWIEVTDGVQEVVLEIGDPESETIARKSLPAGPYRAVRTLFRRVEANIRSGLEVDGEPIVGRIPVDLGLSDRLQVERILGLDVVDRDLSELVIDLHAERWLRRLDRDRRTVSQEHFQDELKLRHHR